jgi:hypothetical protein
MTNDNDSGVKLHMGDARGGSAVQTAIVSGVVAIVTASIPAYVTLHSSKSELKELTSRAEVVNAQVKQPTVDLNSAQVRSAPNVEWKSADLQTGWAPDDRYAPIGYSKDSSGFVHLRGVALGTGHDEAHPMSFCQRGIGRRICFKGRRRQKIGALKQVAACS